MTADQLDLIHGQALAEITARRLAIAKAAEAIVTASTLPNTARAFAQDWATWELFCAGGDVDPADVSADALVLFATWLATGSEERRPAAPSTITRRLSGVLDGWHERKLEVPRNITRDARKVIAKYERYLAEENVTVGRGKAPALTVKHLRRICDVLPQSKAGIRDRALVLVGFGMAARRSELAGLQVSDIRVTDDGLDITVRTSKTGARNPAIPPGSNDATCPVKAWQRWQTAAGIITGPAFRRVDRHDRVLGAMSPKAVGEAITRAGERAKLDVRLTGHSVRSGLATEARRAGHDAKTIADQGGWLAHSAVLHGYMQTVDRWTDNAVKGIGL